MYNPTKFSASDKNGIIELVQKNSFATVISISNNEPVVSHLPLVVEITDGQFELVGHMAKANPQWRSFQNSEVTAIFHGPHTYITPTWYEENDVPTWNYVVAHLKGRAELIETENGIIDCLKILSKETEKSYPSGWDFFIPEDLHGEVLTKSIIGFKIKVDKVDFKKKLSQNRTDADRVGILSGLENRKDEQSHLVLNEMKKNYSSDGKLR